MKQYTGEEKVYVPDYKGEYEACDIKTGAPKRGRLVPVSNAIVLTPDELLDLMQESIEHSYPTLTRSTATDLLFRKGIKTNLK